MNDDLSVILESYQHYISKEGFFKEQYTWSFNYKKAISWWKTVKAMSDHKKLADIALRLLHIQPTNTAVERKFSKQDFIHRKELNRLPPDRVHKLMFVHSNINTFDSNDTFCPEDFVLESDSDDEEDEEEE